MDLTKSKWFEDFEKVLNLAKWLEEEGRVTTAFQMLQIFEKPWKWEQEWNEYQAAKKAEAVTA
jgi:hypothetical protein